MANTHHSNKKIKWNKITGNAYYDNGKQAYSKATGKFYDKNGKLIKKSSFSISLGKGITLKIIQNISVTVYCRKISQQSLV